MTDSLTLWNKWLQAFSSAASDRTLGKSERGLARRAAGIMKSLVYNLVHAMGLKANMRRSSLSKILG